MAFSCDYQEARLKIHLFQYLCRYLFQELCCAGFEQAGEPPSRPLNERAPMEPFFTIVRRRHWQRSTQPCGRDALLTVVVVGRWQGDMELYLETALRN